MSETDISTAAVEAHAKRLRNHGHSGTHGILPVTMAMVADRDRLAAEVVRLREARVVLIASDRGVCIGGRWDGWLMVRHPDGHWVSHHKLETVDPATEMTDLLRNARAARREGEA